MRSRVPAPGLLGYWATARLAKGLAKDLLAFLARFIPVRQVSLFECPGEFEEQIIKSPTFRLAFKSRAGQGFYVQAAESISRISRLSRLST